MEAWAKLAAASIPAAPAIAPALPAQDPPGQLDLASWLSSPDAIPLVRELRWALLPLSAVRLRAAHPCGRASDNTFLNVLHQAGVPTARSSLPCWGASGPTWDQLTGPWCRTLSAPYATPVSSPCISEASVAGTEGPMSGTVCNRPTKCNFVLIVSGPGPKHSWHPPCNTLCVLKTRAHLTELSDPWHSVRPTTGVSLYSASPPHASPPPPLFPPLPASWPAIC